MIECSNITSAAEELKLAFKKCSKLKASDMDQLVNLIIAVQNCQESFENIHEGYTDSGTRLVDLIATIGDYDNSNNNTYIKVSDDTGQIFLNADDGLWIKSNFNTDFTTQLQNENLTKNTINELPSANGVLSVLSLSNLAPSSNTDSGSKGEVRIVGNTRYECIEDNQWVSSTVNTTF